MKLSNMFKLIPPCIPIDVFVIVGSKFNFPEITYLNQNYPFFTCPKQPFCLRSPVKMIISLLYIRSRKKVIVKKNNTTIKNFAVFEILVNMLGQNS